MRRNIIGISGRIGAGKDTVAGIIRELTDKWVTPADGSPGYNYISGGWEIKKYAFKLKQIASLMLGVPAEKFEDQEFKKTRLSAEWGGMTVREFLQRLGTDAIRDNIHTDAWINALFADLTEDSKWLITDTRFENEAQAIKDYGGIVIRVHRDLPGTGYTTLEQFHPSETALDKWVFDYFINNTGSINDLTLRVRSMLQQENFLIWQ